MLCGSCAVRTALSTGEPAALPRPGAPTWARRQQVVQQIARALVPIATSGASARMTMSFSAFGIAAVLRRGDETSSPRISR
jgi:hypothetical protein